MSTPASPLSRLQLDILDLESQTWPLEGSKITEFRIRHPRHTETAYYLALGRLLHDRRAYEYAGGRYAEMLNRIARTADQAALRRGLLRTGGTGS